MRRLVGAGHVDGAVVGDEAHGAAIDARLGAHRCHAVACLEFEQLGAIDEARDHFAHVHGLAQVIGHQGQQIICGQRRAWGRGR